jgi:hypothetical protein
MVLKIIGGVLLTFGVIAFIAVLMGFPLMLLWNALLPGLFGIKTISFWQAIGINLLTGIMFRSHSSSSSKS